MVAALWSSMRLLWPQWLVKPWLWGSAGRQRWCWWQIHCSVENFFMCGQCCLWCDLAFLPSSLWMIKVFPSGDDWRSRSSWSCWEMEIIREWFKERHDCLPIYALCEVWFRLELGVNVIVLTLELRRLPDSLKSTSWSFRIWFWQRRRTCVKDH